MCFRLSSVTYLLCVRSVSFFGQNLSYFLKVTICILNFVTYREFVILIIRVADLSDCCVKCQLWQNISACIIISSLLIASNFLHKACCKRIKRDVYFIFYFSFSKLDLEVITDQSAFKKCSFSLTFCQNVHAKKTEETVNIKYLCRAFQ
jgi:hypothetical protein